MTSVDKLIDIKRDQFDHGEKKNSAKNKDLSYAQIFIDVHDLGRRITLHSSFNEFLSHIPDFKWESRVYLARIDDLPIGKGYGDLDKWDMALETGFIDGLIRKGLTIAEKLDHVKPLGINQNLLALLLKMPFTCMELILKI